MKHGEDADSKDDNRISSSKQQRVTERGLGQEGEDDNQHQEGIPDC